jgi:inosine/xanthosine triphosphatase
VTPAGGRSDGPARGRAGAPSDAAGPQRGLGWVRSVRVGTLNRPKLGAARAALRPFAPEARVLGAAVDSGVPEQPVGFDEILLGAENRARAALRAGGDLGIGIEDGLVPICGVTAGEARHLNLGCAVVTDGSRLGVGLSSGFAYPPDLTAAAAQGREPIGPLFDRFWQEHRGVRRGGAAEVSGRSVGNVGKLTGGVLTRQEYGRHAVVCALVRFLHPDLYGDAPATRVSA